MSVIKIKPDIYSIGVNDMTTDLFEGLWPIAREGVSYNSYLIMDEKKAIIDLAKAFKGDQYLTNIDEVCDLKSIDYLIINHMEPDHSGLIRTFRRVCPDVTLVGSEKTKKMLAEFFGITDNVMTVKDGETLSLGKRTLQFIEAPFIHWPETIMTYDQSDRILFSCDAFGGYGAIKGGMFDDDCRRQSFYEQEALRYYVNILANYSARVLSHIDKLKDLPIDIIAPSHGLIWRDNASHIVDLYKKWGEYADKPGDPGVTIIFGSMYGNTESAMNAVASGISRAGVPVDIFDAARTHVSYILPSLWKKRGVMIGAPTYEVSLFPPVAEVLRTTVHKRIKEKTAAYFGSYGWSGGALREIKKIIEPLRWDLFDTYEFIGGAAGEELKKAEEFGYAFGCEILKK